MKSKVLLALSLILALPLIILPYSAAAHPGNTASDGCHYCRTNCDRWGVAWNERHCHGSAASPSAPSSGSSGTGRALLLGLIIGGGVVWLVYRKRKNGRAVTDATGKDNANSDGR